MRLRITKESQEISTISISSAVNQSRQGNTGVYEGPSCGTFWAWIRLGILTYFSWIMTPD
jgi:hypothetical protein